MQIGISKKYTSQEYTRGVSIALIPYEVIGTEKVGQIIDVNDKQWEVIKVIKNEEDVVTSVKFSIPRKKEGKDEKENSKKTSLYLG